MRLSPQKFSTSIVSLLDEHFQIAYNVYCSSALRDWPYRNKTRPEIWRPGG
jgi:hypothetical protein